jgi:hypothetical protein
LSAIESPRKTGPTLETNAKQPREEVTQKTELLARRWLKAGATPIPGWRDEAETRVGSHQAESETTKGPSGRPKAFQVT